MFTKEEKKRLIKRIDDASVEHRRTYEEYIARMLTLLVEERLQGVREVIVYLRQLGSEWASPELEQFLQKRTTELHAPEKKPCTHENIFVDKTSIVMNLADGKRVYGGIICADCGATRGRIWDGEWKEKGQ